MQYLQHGTKKMNYARGLFIEYLGFKRSKVTEYRKSKGIIYPKKIRNFKYTTLKNGRILSSSKLSKAITYQIEYDSAGNFIEENMLFNDKILNSDESKYDTQGNCILSLSVSHPIKKPGTVDSTKSGYIYNKKGLCIEEDIYNVTNDSVDAKNLYMYDIRNSVVQEIDMRNSGNDTINISHSNYDKYGNWLKGIERDSKDIVNYTLFERTIRYY